MTFRGGKTTIEEDRVELRAPSRAEMVILIRRQSARLHAVEAQGPTARLGARKGNPGSEPVGRGIDITRFPVPVQQLDIPSERRGPASVALREEVKCEEKGQRTAGKDTRQETQARKAKPQCHAGQVSAGHDLPYSMPVLGGVTMRQAQGAPIPRRKRALHLVNLAHGQAVPGSKGVAKT
jgi:hypothetical protein